MSEEEFIRQAQLDWEDNNIVTIVDAMEANYGNGNYDDFGGDAEAPTGHFYIIERWIAVTNSDGITSVETFESTQEAELAFEKLEKAFDEWDAQ